MATSTGGTFGITVGITPSTDNWWQRVQVDKATTSTGVPSSGSTMWSKLAEMDQTVSGSTVGASLNDSLPNDGIVRHYRTKGVAAGYNPSVYWSVVSASPTLINPGPQ